MCPRGERLSLPGRAPPAARVWGVPSVPGAPDSEKEPGPGECRRDRRVGSGPPRGCQQAGQCQQTRTGWKTLLSWTAAGRSRGHCLAPPSPPPAGPGSPPPSCPPACCLSHPWGQEPGKFWPRDWEAEEGRGAKGRWGGSGRAGCVGPGLRPPRESEPQTAAGERVASLPGAVVWNPKTHPSQKRVHRHPGSVGSQ